MESSVNIYYDQWVSYMRERGYSLPQERVQFEGLELFHLSDFERCFNVSLTMCSIEEDGTVSIVHHPTTKHQDKLYIHLHNNHLSYISKFNSYSTKYKCSQCDRLFKHLNDMRKHLRICSNVSKFKFPGGVHKQPNTLFQDLEEIGIHVAERERF